MSEVADHERHMRHAIRLAERVPDLPFGSVIVHGDSGDVLAEGCNCSAENPAWHGEIDAINRCARAHPGVDWSPLVLYTTAEPCPMCAGAILWAGLRGVVFGSSIPFLQGLGWWQIDIRAEEVFRRAPFRSCRLLGGVLEAQCNELVLRAGRRWRERLDPARPR